ncbi:MAG: hypothetical protein MK161_17645, partial [Pirellulales bacterium]|nr:hypothetical protein [Pirellulales bacterium]
DKDELPPLANSADCTSSEGFVSALDQNHAPTTDEDITDDEADIDLEEMMNLLGTCRTDVNSSGDIEFGDIIEVLSNFGSTCD